MRLLVCSLFILADYSNYFDKLCTYYIIFMCIKILPYTSDCLWDIYKNAKRRCKALFIFNIKRFIFLINIKRN